MILVINMITKLEKQKKIGVVDSLRLRVRRGDRIPQAFLDKYLQREDIDKRDKIAVAEVYEKEGRYGDAAKMYLILGLNVNATACLRMLMDYWLERRQMPKPPECVNISEEIANLGDATLAIAEIFFKLGKKKAAIQFLFENAHPNSYIDKNYPQVLIYFMKVSELFIEMGRPDLAALMRWKAAAIPEHMRENETTRVIEKMAGQTDLELAELYTKMRKPNLAKIILGRSKRKVDLGVIAEAIGVAEEIGSQNKRDLLDSLLDIDIPCPERRYVMQLKNAIETGDLLNYNQISELVYNQHSGKELGRRWPKYADKTGEMGVGEQYRECQHGKRGKALDELLFFLKEGLK